MSSHEFHDSAESDRDSLVLIVSAILKRGDQGVFDMSAVDRLAELHEAEQQRDRLAEVVRAATVLIAAKGRHNTLLAYEGLRDVLATLNRKEES